MPDVDVYRSADVETDGAIPGPYSMLSFALVPAGRFDGHAFRAPATYDDVFYRELRPVGPEVDVEALRVSGLDRDRLTREGTDPARAMSDAAAWVRAHARDGTPILVAYPLSVDWSWLHWYFTRFSDSGSPFEHSRAFDLRTAHSPSTFTTTRFFRRPSNSA